MTYAIYLKQFIRSVAIALLSFTVHQPSALFAQPNSSNISSEPTQEQLQNIFWSWVRNPDVNIPDTLNSSIKDEQDNVVAVFIQSNLKGENGRPFTISSSPSFPTVSSKQFFPSFPSSNDILRPSSRPLRTTYFRGNVFWAKDSIWAYYHTAVCGVGSIREVIVGRVVERRGDFRPQAGCIPRTVSSVRSGRFNISIDGQVFDLDNTDIAESTDLSVSPILNEAWQTFSPSNPALDSDRTPGHFSVSPEVIAALQNSDNPGVTLRIRISGENLFLRLSEETVRDLKMMYLVAEN